MKKVVTVGTKKQVEACVYTEEVDRSEYGRRYKHLYPRLELGGVAFELNLTPAGIQVYVSRSDANKLSRLFGKKIRGGTYLIITLTDEARKEIEGFLREVNKRNEEERRKAFSYPSKLRVRRWEILDMPYLILLWNKPDELVEDEKKNVYDDMVKFLKETGKKGKKPSGKQRKPGRK